MWNLFFNRPTSILFFPPIQPIQIRMPMSIVWPTMDKCRSSIQRDEFIRIVWGETIDVSFVEEKNKQVEFFRTSSNRQLHSLARDLKKKADQSRRTTFEEIRQSMSFYLESVCYFMKCASDEQVSQQRTALLTDILNMLQYESRWRDRYSIFLFFLL